MQMKWHNNLIFGVIEGLDKIFLQKKYANKVVKNIIEKNKKWGVRDRGLISQTIFECVRWYRKYIYCSGLKELNSQKDLWDFLGAYIVIKKQELPKIDQFSSINKVKIEKKQFEIKNNRKINESIPDWLDKIGVDNFGEEIWNKEVCEFNKRSHLVIRCNTLKSNIIELKKQLEIEEINFSEIKNYPNALIIKGKNKITNLNSYKAGFFEIQDANSQRVALSCSIKPGMTIIDACAGAGGKTMHIGELLNNNGKIFALDPDQKKLNELKKRAKRNGINIIKTLNSNNIKSIMGFVGKADRVLIDAPCSGLGVIKRNPDTKLKMNPLILKSKIKIQKKLINYWSKYVKEKGELIYATCSIFDQENKNQIRKFLENENGKNFFLKKEETYLSHITGFDGFYIAQLKKCE
tara:strand:- start:882 stop:2102 length:1221 start_codon:yes stop_codon:yes gene_type:complete